MLYGKTSNNGVSIHERAGRLLRHVGLLVVALCWLNGDLAEAQTRLQRSHGKIKLDSYNHLLRDVHPASQAQANYLQLRLYLTGLRKAERLERQERLDVYAERQFVNRLADYQRVARLLSAGRPTSARSLKDFWLLISLFGDHAEVYEALSSEVPPMPHDQFVPTFQFIGILEPNGELEPLPLLLDGAAGLDASKFQVAWDSLMLDMHSTGRISAEKVAAFHRTVADYLQQCASATQTEPGHSGRFQVAKYLKSLGALADALYRPQQSAQIEQFVRQNGYDFEGDNTLALFQHMLRNRLTPAHGSTAQLALAEVARPLSRVLEQEIALHFERIDSLAANEGHRPYAAEYRGQSDPFGGEPDRQVSQLAP